MKKIIIAAAIITSSVVVNAASFTWNVGNVYTPTLSNLSPNKNDGTLIPSDANVLATLMWSSDGTSWKEVGDASTGVAFSKAGGFSTAQTAFSSDSMPSDMDFGINYFKVLVEYTDAQGTKFKTELFEKSNTSATATDLTNLANSGTLVSFYGVTGSTTGRTWTTEAVPEPTSGLLLLLGVAGLALRRRRA